MHRFGRLARCLISTRLALQAASVRFAKTSLHNVQGFIGSAVADCVKPRAVRPNSSSQARLLNGRNSSVYSATIRTSSPIVSISRRLSRKSAIELWVISRRPEDFVMELRERAVTPHVAQNDTNRRSAIDGRTTRHSGYAVSMRIRKRIEEAFGWAKTVAGLRKMRHRGLPKVDWQFTLAMAAYNLIRLPKLLADPA